MAIRYVIRDEDVGRLSRFVHKRHINLLGYSFAVPVARGELRPLRHPTMQTLNPVLRSIAP